MFASLFAISFCLCMFYANFATIASHISCGIKKTTFCVFTGIWLTNCMRAGMKNKSLVSSYLDSAKIQWMYTWSFCSERGKHVKWRCDAGMMLLSFVSHLTKSLACMFFLSCITLAWMENQSTKQKREQESKTANLLNTTGLSYYPHHIL